MFGTPIFLFLGVRKGDRGLLLVLPLLVSMVAIGLIALMAWGLLAGRCPAKVNPSGTGVLLPVDRSTMRD